MVIYKVKGGPRYIGSTARQFHIKFKEHNTSKVSNVYQHKQMCKKNIEGKIIGRANSFAELRMLESMMIVNEKPNINKKEEIDAANIMIIDIV